MVDWKTRLAQKVSAAQALEKVADGHESAKDPEALIDGAADVQVDGNLPAGVEIPGEAGMTGTGLTPEDKGKDIGHVEEDTVETTEGKESVTGNNPEVTDIIESAKEFEKCASALEAFAKQILAAPDSAFSGGVVKTASAEITESDVEKFILKRASEGDPVAQGMINYCQMVYKAASEEGGVPAEAIAESGDLEAGLAQVQEQVAAAIKQEYPDIPDEVAQQVAAQSTAAAVQQAMGEGEVAQGEQPDEGAIADELVAQVAEELKAQVPDLSDEEASSLAVQAVADTLQGGAEGAPEEAVAKEASAKREAAPAKREAAPKVEKKAAAEDAVEEPASEEPAAEEAPAAEEVAAEAAPEDGSAETDAAEEVGQVVIELAQEIKSENPEVSDDEALQGAVEAVSDALQTIGAQQAIGEVGEDGQPTVSDEDAAEIVDTLGKTASDNPLRDPLCMALNERLGLSPEAFAKRLPSVIKR